MKLTKATVDKLALPVGKSELIVFDEDMPGFGLRLRAGGSAVWVAQYRVGAKQRRVTLGRIATLDPDRARRAAREVLAKADLGHDAQAERRERQARAAVTLGAVIQLYLKRVQATRKPKTLTECRRYLERGWRPFHAKPIHEINRRDVATRLNMIAEEHGPIASNRARATLSAFYAWAIAQGIADLNPVIGTSRVGAERPRERVVSASEIRDIWNASGEDDHGRILKLLLLTGQRRGEVAGMIWGELDLDRALWSMPAARTKNDLSHDVPLSGQVVALLRAVQRDRATIDDAPRGKAGKRRKASAFLFGQAGGPFSGWSQSKRRLDARIAQQRAEARLGRPLDQGEYPERRRSASTMGTARPAAHRSHRHERTGHPAAHRRGSG